MSLRFAYNTNGAANHRLDDALALISEAGYDGVALTLDHHHLDPYAPDLAGRAARQGSLTPESTAEQADAGLDWLTDEELTSFSHMNQEYRARFGFPFVVCVGEHTKESILTSFAARLENDRERETETALAEVCRIARLRLHDLIAAPAEERL